jgi:hypothetical protein
MRLDLQQDTLAVCSDADLQAGRNMNSSHTVQVCSVCLCLVSNYKCRLTNEPHCVQAVMPRHEALMAEISLKIMEDVRYCNGPSLWTSSHVYTCEADILARCA